MQVTHSSFCFYHQCRVGNCQHFRLFHESRLCPVNELSFKFMLITPCNAFPLCSHILVKEIRMSNLKAFLMYVFKYLQLIG